MADIDLDTLTGTGPAPVNDSSIDISISLMLTERTLVKQQGDALHVQNIPEPPPPEPVTRTLELYVAGKLMSKWDE